MSKLFCVMGKSSSGKDTIYKALLEDKGLNLNTVIPYTTRPIREGETNGIEYFFVDDLFLEEARKNQKVIESRAYHTIHGVWNYFMMDDGQLDFAKGNYIVIGTLESYRQIQKYFGEDKVVPIYVYVEDGLRLSRALERERGQRYPRYAELCRRFLADAEDFSEDKVVECRIHKRYNNIKLEDCLKEIKSDILSDTDR